MGVILSEVSNATKSTWLLASGQVRASEPGTGSPFAKRSFCNAPLIWTSIATSSGCRRTAHSVIPTEVEGSRRVRAPQPQLSQAAAEV